MEEDIAAGGHDVIGGCVDRELAVAVQIITRSGSRISLSIYIYRDAVDPGIPACAVWPEPPEDWPGTHLPSAPT